MFPSFIFSPIGGLNTDALSDYKLRVYRQFYQKRDKDATEIWQKGCWQLMPIPSIESS